MPKGIKYNRYLHKDSNEEMPRTTKFYRRKSLIQPRETTSGDTEKDVENDSINNSRQSEGLYMIDLSNVEDKTHSNFDVEVDLLDKYANSDLINVNTEQVSDNEEVRNHRNTIDGQQDDDKMSIADTDWSMNDELSNELNDNDVSDEDDILFSDDKDSVFNEAVCQCTQVSRKEVMLMSVLLGIRHSHTWAAIVDNLKMINIIFGKKCVPESRHKLHKYFPAEMDTVKYHLYCPQCTQYLGERSNSKNVTCDICSTTFDTSKMDNFFLEFDLEHQLRNLLQNSNMAESTNYRFLRTKSKDDNFEDIYDGECYKNLSKPGGVLYNRWNFSYIFNTDGCQSANSSNLKIWPIYVMLNELPPKIRSKHILVAGLWVQKREPTPRRTKSQDDVIVTSR